LSEPDVAKQLDAMVDGAATHRWGQVEAAARRIAESAGTAGPSSPLLAAGRDAIEQGDYDGAAWQLRRATAQAPSDWKAWSARGYAELRRNDLRAANVALIRSLQLHPDDASAWAHRGVVLAVQGNAAASAAALQLAVYFSTQRARTLAHLRAPAPPSLIAPEFKAVIQEAGNALDDLPPRRP
jgi:Flp pilus assembly protein TadD